MVSLLSLIFPINLNKSYEQNESIDTNNRNNILLIGKESECKRSLLFQMSETIASQEYDDIHIITAQTMEKVVDGVNGMPFIDVRNGHLLQFLKIVYLSTFDSLRDYLLDMDSRPSTPTAIIIDNISHYLRQSSDKIERNGQNESLSKRAKYQEKDEMQSLAKLSALLINAGNYCAKKRNGKCYTVMSFNTNQTVIMDHLNNSKMAKSIGQRFYENIWSLEKKSEFNNQINYEMECNSRDSVLNVNFFQKDNQIFLNRITKTK